MSEIKVDCTGETCPVPLVETRKALRKAKEGDVVEVVGTHPTPKKEIPIAILTSSLPENVIDISNISFSLLSQLRSRFQ